MPYEFMFGSVRLSQVVSPRFLPRAERKWSAQGYPVGFIPKVRLAFTVFLLSSLMLPPIHHTKLSYAKWYPWLDVHCPSLLGQFFLKKKCQYRKCQFYWILVLKHHCPFFMRLILLSMLSCLGCICVSVPLYVESYPDGSST